MSQQPPPPCPCSPVELDSDSSLEITLLYSDSDAEDTFYDASSTFAVDSTDDETTEAVRQKADPVPVAGGTSNRADELADHLSRIHIHDRTQYVVQSSSQTLTTPNW